MKAYELSATYIDELKVSLAKAAESRQTLYDAIVNCPFNTKEAGLPLGLGIVVLLLVNKTDKTIDRIALADTEQAYGTLEFSVKPFNEIRIPLDNKSNSIAKAIHSNKYQVVSDWKYLFIPALTAEEARFNQAGGGIGCSVVYPLTGFPDGGALIFSHYLQPSDLSAEHHKFMKQYAKLASASLASLAG